MTSARLAVIASGSALVALVSACSLDPAAAADVEPSCSATYARYADARDLLARADLVVRVTATGEREQARAVALGAEVEPHQPSLGVRVVRDPDGHVFCLFLPGA